MKILNKIKKIFVTMWVALIGFSTKVFCLNANNIEPMETLYGIPESMQEPSLWEKILNISKVLIIPII